jgi:hypothetical protein
MTRTRTVPTAFKCAPPVYVGVILHTINAEIAEIAEKILIGFLCDLCDLCV